MLILGVVLIVLGLASTIYGVTLNNSAEAQLNALFGTGVINPGTTWIIVGAVVGVIGIILLVVELLKKSKVIPTTSSTYKTYKTYKEETRCTNCGKKLEGTPAYCPYCGSPTKPGAARKENICPYCESVIPSGVTLCPACGNDISKVLDSEPSMEPAESEKPEKPNPAYSALGLSKPKDSDL